MLSSSTLVALGVIFLLVSPLPLLLDFLSRGSQLSIFTRGWACGLSSSSSIPCTLSLFNIEDHLRGEIPSSLFPLHHLYQTAHIATMSGDISGIHYSKLDLNESSDDAFDLRRQSSIESHLDPNITGGYCPQPDAIIPEQGRFPFCIVWTPLPLITCVWLVFLNWWRSCELLFCEMFWGYLMGQEIVGALYIHIYTAYTWVYIYKYI